MFDCLEQLEPFAACFLQLRRTLVDLIPDRMSFIVDKNCIILLFCTQIPAVRIHADVLLVAEVPLVALFDGMSFRTRCFSSLMPAPSSSLIRLIVNCFFTSLLYPFFVLLAVLSLCGIALKFLFFAIKTKYQSLN